MRGDETGAKAGRKEFKSIAEVRHTYRPVAVLGSADRTTRSSLIGAELAEQSLDLVRNAVLASRRKVDRRRSGHAKSAR